MAKVETSKHAKAPLVAGPSRVSVSYGLFSVLPFDSSVDPHWQLGIQWEEADENKLLVSGLAACEPDAQVPGFPQTDKFEGGVDTDYAPPFTLSGTFECSPFDHAEGYAYERAQQRLLLLEEREAERVLWNGTDWAEPTEDNTLNGLSDAEVLASMPMTNVAAAVARLEQHIANTYGTLGVLHMNRETATLLMEKLKLDSRGGRLFTPLGTPVVAGQGYGGGAIVATGSMFGLRSEVFSGLGQANILDTENNQLRAEASRTYAVGYDTAPLAQITLTETQN